MNRKSIPKFVLLLSLLFLIWGCRATDETIASEKPKFFKVFGEKDNPSLNYSKGFKKLFESYDSIQIDKKTDFKPLTQTFVNKISSTQKNNNSQKEYIDFRFHSQTLKFEDKEVWVYFPIIQDNAVKQIAVAVLSENRTKVNLKLLNTNSQYYKQVYNLFAEAYTKVQNKQVSNNFTAKYAVTCEVGCTNIEEVVITVYEPKSKSETLLAFNWSLWENDGGGGSCGDFNNCFGSGGGFIGNGDGGYNGDAGSDPCEKVKAVGKNDKTKALMSDLKNKTNSTKEVGYILEESSGIITEHYIEGEAGEAGINFSISGGKIDGYIHSHYTGLLSVFSPDDIFAIAQMYKQGLINNINTFTAGVVTASGTQYMMVIDDPTQFQSFADNLFNGSSFDMNTLNAYSHIYDKIYQIKTNNLAAVNEKNFLNYITTSGSGLSLLMGTNDMQNWSVIIKDKDGNIKIIDCN